MDKPRRLTQGDQVLMYLVHHEDATTRVINTLINETTEIQQLALRRLKTIGLADYGDKGWHQPAEEQRREIREELADAIVRSVMLIRRERMYGE